MGHMKSVSFEIFGTQYNVSYPSWVQVVDELQRTWVIDSPLPDGLDLSVTTDEVVRAYLLALIDRSTSDATSLTPKRVEDSRLDTLEAELALVRGELAKVNDAAAAQSELDLVRAELEALKAAQSEA